MKSSWASGCAFARARWAGRTSSRPSKNAPGPTSRCPGGSRSETCRAQVELLYARGQWPGEYGLQAVAPSGSEAHWAKALALAEAWRHWAVQPHAACASVPPSIDAAAQEALQALGCTVPGEGSATFAALLGCTPGAVSCPPVACLSLAMRTTRSVKVTIAPAESFDTFWDQLQACSALKVCVRSDARWRSGRVLRCKCLSARTSSRTCFDWSCST